MLQKLVALKESTSFTPKVAPRVIRQTILEQLYSLVLTGELDTRELTRIGLNFHMYRTVGNKVIDIRSTDMELQEGEIDRITFYLRNVMKKERKNVVFYFTDDLIERLNDFVALKALANSILSRHREVDYVAEFLDRLNEAEDMILRGNKKSLPDKIISLEYAMEVIKVLGRQTRDKSLRKLIKKIQAIRGKINDETKPHYMNYAYSGKRGFQEKIAMFGRQNVGIYLRVAAMIPRSDEILIISVNPWRGASSAFTEGERVETIKLLSLFVSLIAKEWKFNRLKIENVPVGHIKAFDADDILRIITAFFSGNLERAGTDGLKDEVLKKMRKIISWGPVWTVEEFMLVVAMFYREAPPLEGFVELLSSDKFKQAGVRLDGDMEQGYYLSVSTLKDPQRARGIVNAGQRRERVSLGDYINLIGG